MVKNSYLNAMYSQPFKSFFSLFLVFFLGISSSRSASPVLVTLDIDHFWQAFDKIQSTKDTALQRRYLKEYYLDRATEGLKAMIRARNYQADEFLQEIRNYPRYWTSLRPRTLRIQDSLAGIVTSFTRLNELHPIQKAPTIYFVIGAFRSPGTFEGEKVMIGAEFSLAGPDMVLDELPEQIRKNIREYAPVSLSQLCTHEYLHTLQKANWSDLLDLCVYEGVCEFLSTHLSKTKPQPPIRYGMQHEQQVRDQFMKEILLTNTFNNWFWGQNQNGIPMDDLGYYIGYAIAEGYFRNATDKKKAVAKLIELDYSVLAELGAIVDGSRYLPRSVWQIQEDFYDKNCVRIGVTLSPYGEDSKDVDTAQAVLSLHFSEPMDTTRRGFHYGPSGEKNAIRIQRILGWSADEQTFRFMLEPLEAGKRYELSPSMGFRNKAGQRMRPVVFTFQTKR